jgi:hypothetical protein
MDYPETGHWFRIKCLNVNWELAENIKRNSPKGE